MKHISAYLVLSFCFLLVPGQSRGQVPALKGGLKALGQNAAAREKTILKSLTREINDASVIRLNQTYLSDLIRADAAYAGHKEVADALERIVARNAVLQNHSFQQLLRARNEIRLSVRTDFDSSLRALPKMAALTGRLVLFLDASSRDWPDAAAFLSALKEKFKSNIYIMSYGKEGVAAPFPRSLGKHFKGSPVYQMTYVPGLRSVSAVSGKDGTTMPVQDFAAKEGFCFVSLPAKTVIEEETIAGLKSALKEQDPYHIVVVVGRGLGYTPSRPDFLVTRMLSYEPIAPIAASVIRFDKVASLLDKDVMWNRLTVLDESAIELFDRDPAARMTQQVDGRSSMELLGSSARIISR